jgi:subtilisin family serine protease
MKTIYLYILLSVGFITVSPFTDAQNIANRQALLNLADSMERKAKAQKAEALRFADSLGLIVRTEYSNGRVTELMRIENGIPIYYTTYNSNGALLIGTRRVYPGGSASLNLTGAGQTLGIWDVGRVLTTHRELPSVVNMQPVTVPINYHATHVAGTMVALGIDRSAQGMAYQASLNAYNWNQEDQIPLAVADGLLVSNHSYGDFRGWSWGTWATPGVENWHWFGDVDICKNQDYLFGFYSEKAKKWDQISFHAPNYLIVQATGNFRDLKPKNINNPYYVWDKINGKYVTTTGDRSKNGRDGGYDCLAHEACAKNILTVGAVNSFAEMYNKGGWGPTDDGRIKPDIVAKGVDVYSTWHTSDNKYETMSGTSMASPMVSGSIGLLLQHQQNLHPGKLLLSSTLKALIIHTADDLGLPGPDYSFGWGLMNTSKAAKVMSDNAENNLHVFEKTIINNHKIKILVKAKGDEPLRATLVWTDLPGIPPPASLNPTKRMLVNDLNMEIEGQGLTYLPYKLDKSEPGLKATTGVNNVDNVEVIDIENAAPGDSYVIKITHKGTLVGDSQQFSLIITGNNAIEYLDEPIYRLPFPDGAEYPCLQGNSIPLENPPPGDWSHWVGSPSEFAFDFDMPVGSTVVASRSGIVSHVIQSWNNSGLSSDCDRVNRIVIDHLDGTKALYLHLKHNGSLVSEGDVVFQGQPIGLSGNTGCSTNPHLHFMVMEGGPSAWYNQSLPISFCDFPLNNGVPQTLDYCVAGGCHQLAFDSELSISPNPFLKNMGVKGNVRIRNSGISPWTGKLYLAIHDLEGVFMGNLGFTKEISISSGSVYKFTFSGNEFIVSQPAGDYKVFVRYQSTGSTEFITLPGGLYENPVDITIEDPLVLRIYGGGSSVPFCQWGPMPTTTLIANASGGLPPYQYTWPDGLLDVRVNGVYPCSVTDAEGSVATASSYVFFVPVICSHDPNDITGPTGFGPEQWVSGDDILSYTIRFENDPDFATAPAQDVLIKFPVTDNLNMYDFRVGSFGFGNFMFDVPSNRATHTTRLDLRDSIGLFVDFTAGVNVNTQEAFWLFESIDPVTGLSPTDASKGFLPVNDSLSSGEGFINFIIKPKTTCHTGDSVIAQASIIFDDNPPIETNVWVNMIDALPPASTIDEIAHIVDNTYAITFTGVDDSGGSGIGSYQLYSSMNDLPFSLYGEVMKDSVMHFSFVTGSQYRLFSLALDNVGNREQMKILPDTTIESSFSVEPSSLDFGIIAVTDCSKLSYKLNGNFINVPVIIDTPDGFEVSTHPISGFSGSINISPVSGKIDQMIYVKFCPQAQKFYEGEIINIVNGSSSESVNITGYGKIIAQSLELGYNVVIPGETRCLEATKTITTGNPFFIVMSEGSVNIVAGQSIILNPLTVVMNGGYLHAYIANNGIYCGVFKDIENVVVAEMSENSNKNLEMLKKQSFFHLFPNPTRSAFTLELFEVETGLPVTVEIYSMRGERLLRRELTDGNRYKFDLSAKPKGIYLIRVIRGDEAGVEKLILN